MKMPGAYSHSRYNTVSALVPLLSAVLYPQLQPALHPWDWLGTSGVHLHPGESNRLALLVSKWPLFMECVLTIGVLFVYLSKCLAPGRGGEGWQSDMELSDLYGA